MKLAKNSTGYKKSTSSSMSTMNLSVQTLDIFCKFVIADPSLVNVVHISNLYNLMRVIDPAVYTTDFEKNKRVKFIMRGIDARLQYNLQDRNLVIHHIISGLDTEPDFIDFNRQLTMDEIKWSNNVIEEALKYNFVYINADQFIDLCTRIKSSDFEHRMGYIQEFKTLLGQASANFRKAEINDSLIDMEFSLEDGSFNNSIARVYQTVTNPGRRLISGMQGLNAMTGGGFEEERVYLFLGVTGVGKSITLLNLAYQLKKYNGNYSPKDPSKRPCIVYLTMENSVVETVTRLFDMVTDSQFGMGSYSLEEVVRKLKEEGQLILNDNSPIDIVIRYKANRTVDTSYLYQLYDDLLDQGKEMICLIQDHLLRIRSVFGNPDTRQELGDVVNEFKAFATEKRISVITDFHLNREAIKILEQYQNAKSQTDVTQRLGKSNVSESLLILNNTDVAININKDTDPDGNSMMCFQLTKMRDKTNVFYFAQPFAYGNPIRLVEDVNGPAMFKESVRGNPNVQHVQNVRTTSANSMGPISLIAKSNKSADTSFLDNDRYNNINLDDDLNIEEVNIKTPPVVSPFSIMPVRTYTELHAQNELKNSIMEDLAKRKVG